MAAPRRRAGRAAILARERAPRLVLRFALVLSLSLALASAVILVVVRHFALSEAERAATRHASLVASALLQREVEPRDLARPVAGARRRELDAVFRPLVRTEDVLGIRLVRHDGLVTYATDRRGAGTTGSAALAAEAAGGTIVSRAAHAPGDEKVLETYAPANGRDLGGAAVIVQSYAPIHAAARSAQLRVGVVLEALLVLLLLVFVPLLARVTRRIRAQMDEIHFRAYHDALTGLPNRAQLRERLDLAVVRGSGQGRVLTVLLADLDRFREINSTFGHEVGDALLCEIARRLREAMGTEGLLLGRLGADEFALVAECADEREAKALAERMRAAVDPPTAVAGISLAVGATVGLAFAPKDGADADTLLKHAEVATYAAKEWHVGVLAYDAKLDPHDPEQLAIVGELGDAAARGELRLRYQPRVALATRSVAGFEALVYWEHPTRGLLSPGAFVPAAERTGAIRHVTRAVLASAVRQLAEWTALDPACTVSVNLSVVDVLDPKLPGRLRALLRRHGVEPSRLYIELTERTVITAPDRVRPVLRRIARSGVRIAIDDFGTGHASLAQLRELPVHEVKVDRSFVRDLVSSPSDRTIVRAAIQLGHSLGLRVVAEGVESEVVDAVLRELGCDEAQGYLYGRPVSVEAATALLSEAAAAAA